ncbi:hypothetical protein [Neobacillus endophyticus]|uniref:hypothetical protein n=1 Tax=Neobacillus endophyticus TaxID=2738405 RepID=UPI001C27EDFC|nr:hypothetical protein [Neobacillus endophyticus]
MKLILSGTTLLLPTARGGFLVVQEKFPNDIGAYFTQNPLQNFSQYLKKKLQIITSFPYPKEKKITTGHPHNI